MYICSASYTWEFVMKAIAMATITGTAMIYFLFYLTPYALNQMTALATACGLDDEGYESGTHHHHYHHHHDA